MHIVSNNWFLVMSNIYDFLFFSTHFWHVYYLWFLLFCSRCCHYASTSYCNYDIHFCHSFFTVSAICMFILYHSLFIFYTSIATMILWLMTFLIHLALIFLYSKFSLLTLSYLILFFFVYCFLWLSLPLVSFYASIAILVLFLTFLLF